MTMGIKESKWNSLRWMGFLPFEIKEFGNIVLPKAFIKARIRLKAQALLDGYNSEQYYDLIRSEYALKGCYVDYHARPLMMLSLFESIGA